MGNNNTNNDEGFALVLELVVVAMVLSAVGFGVYQYNTKSNVGTRAQVSTVSSAADVNAAIVKSADLEVTESNGVDALGDEIQATEEASLSIQGGVDENSY